ncbi:hypothetical protein, partial [Candidatus Pelagibacter sp. HIMB1715]|uniref:hypothetical protein n=1 Tax=Candidatus Pelagibacter sp. HIMB1715 TaxID=3413369 RepID=UPI003F83F045
MFKYKINLFSFIGFLLITFNAHGENKVAFIDIDFLISNINIGKEIILKLENNEKKKSDELQLLENKLKDEEN